MKAPRFFPCFGVILASITCAAHAADRMLGLVPTDGATMLVKQFTVPAGTTITGIRLNSNDATTTFPEIALVRGPLLRLADGTAVATATNVQPGNGVTVVAWPTSITVTQSETYYAAVRYPAGPGKQGPGLGPGLGASDVASPNGSYVAGSAVDALTPITVDLHLSLVTQGGNAGKAGGVRAEEPGETGAMRAHENLSTRATDGGVPVTIRFTLGSAAAVAAGVYDVTGRLIRDLFSAHLAAGSHEYKWDGRDDDGRQTAAGVYLVRLQRGDATFTHKVVIAR